MGPEERLERGEVLYFPTAPFRLPQGPDHEFLLRQELGKVGHKNISYNPATGKASGFIGQGRGDGDRLRAIFAAFSEAVTTWMSQAFPRYQRGCQLDRVSYRPQEEATRRLRHTARNDLLHVDAFPNRPSQGQRILRVFANVNPHDPRIWVTSLPFAQLLERYGAEAGLPGWSGGRWIQSLGEGVLKLFQPARRRRSEYDRFMLRFHDYLKRHEAFQEHGPKRLWTFPPGSVWVAMTDTCSHAVLRGRFALEHSFFIRPEALALPDEAPAALLQQACERSRGSQAA